MINCVRNVSFGNSRISGNQNFKKVCTEGLAEDNETISSLNIARNRKRYDKMQKDINEVKTVISEFKENENVVNGNILKVVDGKVCTPDGNPFSGVSKSILNPGMTVYGSFEKGKIKSHGIIIGKIYAITNCEDKSAKIYTVDSDDKEYLTKASFDKEGKKFTLYTLSGNPEKMDESCTKSEDFETIKKNYKRPGALVKYYAILKRHFGEDAVNNIVGRVLIGTFVFSNSGKSAIYETR